MYIILELFTLQFYYYYFDFKHVERYYQQYNDEFN